MSLRTRVILFAAFCGCLAIVFGSPLVSLFHLALEKDYCTHILIIPATSVLLACLDRDQIFREVRPLYFWSAPIFIVGAALYLLAARQSQKLLGNSLSETTLSFVILVIAVFISCFGTGAFRRASFPLLFLLLVVPLPPAMLNRLIYFLQDGSTLIAYGLFQLLGVPVFRDHFALQLPHFTIEVAEECSSIRSSLALFITGLVAARLFLRKPWTRWLLVALMIPLSVFKNAVRIVTLCLLALHVDPRFLTGKLHRDGGILFYLIALVILCVVLQILRSAEKRCLVAASPAWVPASKQIGTTQ